MIWCVLAVSILAMQSDDARGRQHTDSSGSATSQCKQSSSESKGARPRLVHSPAETHTQQIRLMKLVPGSPAFQVTGTEKTTGSAEPVKSGSAPAQVEPAGTEPGPIAGSKQHGTGGLWLAGDIVEGTARLNWIVGPENAGLLTIDRSGKVRINVNLLARNAEAKRLAGQSTALASSIYVLSNEGLLLLEQLTQADRKYLLYIGNRVRTLGGEIDVKSVLNLDNNFDRRINNYRPHGAKMTTERPPGDFDALIAINPAVVWYNLGYQKVISPGIVTFHELAEAYAKLEYGLEYLPNKLLPGAHSLAVDREYRLESQRPELHNAITAGDNLSINVVQESRKHGPRVAAFLEPTK